jgi:hypothetical protein
MHSNGRILPVQQLLVAVSGVYYYAPAAMTEI